MNLKKKILAITIGPVLILGIITILFTVTMVKNSMMDETKDALKGTAAATLAAYDQNTGDYLETSNGDIWKGSYNISKSENLVDRIKDNTGMDVTFFYGDKRIMTSATDENGNRILKSKAGDVIVEKVLNGGEEYFSEAVSIEGTLNYGYFMPVYQNGSDTDIVGMVFVGTNKQDKDAVVMRLLGSIVAAVVAIMLVCLIVSTKLASTISRNIRTSIKTVEKIAAGDLNVQVNNKLLKSKDEIGDLSRVTITLRDAMQRTTLEINQNVQKLLEASSLLGTAADNTNGTMNKVRTAVNRIVENSTEQAENSKSTSEHMRLMGDNITETSAEVEALNSNAAFMHESSEKAAETLANLQRINGEVERIIGEVQEQTNRTNDSVQQIYKATAFIASIAEETDLLSLNASIEAARAGENGKGFAVVAEQIKKLSEQSNQSSSEIEETAMMLSEDSQKAVEIMQKMQEIIMSQSESMQDTQKVVEEVVAQIANSMQSIQQIKETTEHLANVRNEVLQAVETLSNIAQDSVSGTKKTYEDTEEVVDTFKQVYMSAEQLREIADQLAGSVQYFHVE
ncbi:MULTISPECIES: methyl-accepting chemotaxis protein [unclassified Roseburia]|uniref:methyl-accepting chemotaxis protein n=1 Tax=unclassified Roseburia TaxID=2637578 RepID=UPI000E539447|nr:MULTISPECIES: methyl-accepting chemotaxis protein [unclassified Roseburia]RGG47123.1 methyl-accepting chemotaxis protein [Roseburia sp. AF20-18LB]RGI43208.1 methyl-accepting chemotaxis protein [Roseburia sp. OM04-10BH]RHQ41178.1 methyl-accepting chemotaxis protein [Roseburia sp. AF25-18LB]RHQ43169.1 methyl-accepting chemotaxis protein [Roseburia sp. AF25-25LB]RHQ46548.1 methyl-accepting chemotaxis protein [Roseburia sp. AF25-15LB]